MLAEVAVLGSMRFPLGQLDRIRPHLRALVEATRREDGCIAYDVAEDLFEDGLFRFSELWPDQDSLHRHNQAAHVAAWHVAARQCGILGEDFKIYAVAGALPA